MIVRQLLPLLLLATACVAVLTLAHRYTQARTDDNRRRELMSVVVDAMPLRHDNDLLMDRIVVTDAAWFGNDNPIEVYRARQAAVPVGLVMTPVIAQGYNGPIRLAVGIGYGGEITGVLVREHHETEDLGDQVHQDQSGWIGQFGARSLSNTPVESWAVKGDGGSFDQISGATISPRGVINAVRYTLEYYNLNRESLFK